MDNIMILLGNGFTVDFIKHYEQEMDENLEMDVNNLFHYGQELTITPAGRSGFLSHKNTPNLWALGARSNRTKEENSALIEEILTCANILFDFVNDQSDQKSQRVKIIHDNPSVYINAYSELINYLKNLFEYYNSLISDKELAIFIEQTEWGWMKLFKELKKTNKKHITFITYNYDVWLERILTLLGIDYSMIGFEKKHEKINIIKPHGSISFVQKDSYYVDSGFPVTKSYEDFDSVEIDELQLVYSDLNKYRKCAIIPPSGESGRIQTASWSSTLRKFAEKAVENIQKQDEVVICGLSYWYVDRKELDELIIFINPEATLTLINPNPPRDLNAVLVSIFKDYIAQPTSKSIGGILNV